MDTLAYFLGPAADIFKDFPLTFLDPPVPAGAPGPPEEYREKRIDLNKLLGFGPSAYTWYAQGESMIGAGIQSGDLLIVDKKYTPRVGDIVIADINRQPTVKRLGMEDNRPLLLPENPTHKPIPIDPEEGIRVWGVVTGVYHDFRKSWGNR